jgi:erythromycin esterase
MVGGCAHAAHAQPVRGSDAAQGDGAVVRWAAAHALPIRSVEPGGDAADLRQLAPVLGAARVVALGEPTHGAHEPLAFRNRLFQFLVEELGFTAIALESGLPESRRLADFVAGGAGDEAPDDVLRVTRESLTWGFGAFAENAELVRWIRAYNADPAHRRKVHLYGIDLSLGGPLGSTPTPAAVEAALAYLARVDAVAARGLGARFAPYLKRLPNAAAAFTPAEHDSLTAAIDALVAQLERDRRRYVAASSEVDYAWAYRNAEVAQQGDRVFRSLPPFDPAMPGGGIPPAAWRVMSARDSAMAENVRWVLEREGPGGRVLVYAHDMHVKNAPTEGGVWRGLERPPSAMGQYLRAALGRDLVIVGTSGGPAAGTTAPSDVAPGAAPGSVEALLARVGVPRFVLDLRAARADAAANAWITSRQALQTNGDTFVTLAPGAAFDALLFVGALSPSRAVTP